MIEFYTSSELLPMRNKNGVLKSQPYALKESRKRSSPQGLQILSPSTMFLSPGAKRSKAKRYALTELWKKY